MLHIAAATAARAILRMYMKGSTYKASADIGATRGTYTATETATDTVTDTTIGGFEEFK